MTVRHQADLGMRLISPIFSESFLDLSLVGRVVFVHAAGGGHFTDDPLSSALSLRTLILLCAKLFSFHAIHPANSFLGDFSPSGSTLGGELLRVVVVSNIFFIGCSCFSGLFI